MRRLITAAAVGLALLGGTALGAVNAEATEAPATAPPTSTLTGPSVAPQNAPQIADAEWAFIYNLGFYGNYDSCWAAGNSYIGNSQVWDCFFIGPVGAYGVFVLTYT